MKTMNSFFPKITIITPTFNQGIFIQQTIDSILDQKYPNLEYIVIDGGSTDDTLEILKSYDDQIIWVSEKDRGQSHAINKGLAKASGDIISYLNSDDILEPGALFTVGKYFSTYPEVAWLTGKSKYIDENGVEIRKLTKIYKTFLSSFESYKILSIVNCISQPSTFWRREVLDVVGNFNESLYYSMDYDYWLRIGKIFQYRFVHEYLAHFRVYSKNKTTLSPTNQFKEDLEVAQEHVPSPFFVKLHKLHNKIIVFIYSLIIRYKSLFETS